MSNVLDVIESADTLGSFCLNFPIKMVLKDLAKNDKKKKKKGGGASATVNQLLIYKLVVLDNFFSWVA